MAQEQKVKTPLHLRLTTEDWVGCFKELSRAELGVLYYIRTRDPYGDRYLDIDCGEVGKLLGIHRTSVSRALVALGKRNLIDMEVETAKIRQKINNRRLTLLTNRENESNNEQNKGNETCASTHALERPCTNECADAQLSASAHDVINKERTPEQTIQTNTDFLQTEADSTATSKEVESVKVEIFESNSELLGERQDLNQADTNEAQKSSEDKFSADADSQILQELEAVAYDWHQRPWMVSCNTFKPEMLQAVWRCNPDWYSLEGSQTPNLKKICDRLRNLDNSLKRLNLDANVAYAELQNYWTIAQTLTNPEIEQAFVAAGAALKQKAMQSKLELSKRSTFEAIEDL